MIGVIIFCRNMAAKEPLKKKRANLSLFLKLVSINVKIVKAESKLMGKQWKLSNLELPSKHKLRPPFVSCVHC